MPLSDYGWSGLWSGVAKRRRERGIAPLVGYRRRIKRREEEEEEDRLLPIPEPLTPLTVADPSPIPETIQSRTAFDQDRPGRFSDYDVFLDAKYFNPELKRDDLDKPPSEFPRVEEPPRRETYGMDLPLEGRLGPTPWGARVPEEPTQYIRNPQTGQLVTGTRTGRAGVIDRDPTRPQRPQIRDQRATHRVDATVDLIMDEERRALDTQAGMLSPGMDPLELTREEKERVFGEDRDRLRQKLLESDARLTSFNGLGEYGQGRLSFEQPPEYWSEIGDNVLVQRAGRDAATLEAAIDEIDKQVDILNWRTQAIANDPEGSAAIEARWPDVDWSSIKRQSKWNFLPGGAGLAWETARRAKLKEDRFLLLTMLNDKQTPALREAVSRAYGVDISPDRKEEDIVTDYKKAREDSQRRETLSPGEREAAQQNRDVLDEKGRDINDPLWQSMRDEETSVGPLGDFGVTLGSMLPLLAQTTFNIADIPTGGAVSRAFEKLGYDPVEQQEWNEEFYSEAMRAGQRDFEDAEGMMETLTALMGSGGQHFGKVGLHMGIQQVPNIFLARGVGKAVVSPTLKGVSRAARGVKAARLSRRASRLADNPLWMGSIGEGTISAAESAREIREAAEKGEDISLADWMMVPLTGVSTAGLGRFGAWVANKAGINDIDTLFIKGTRKLTKTGKQWAGNVVKGALQEGLAEELPQSVMEQILLNQALGKPRFEGVEKAAVAGAVLGAGMGAAMQALNFPRRGVKRDEWYRQRDQFRSIIEPRRDELIKKGASASDIDKVVNDVDLAAFGRLREVDPDLGKETAHTTTREAYVREGMKDAATAPVKGINLSEETVDSLVERQEAYEGDSPLETPLHQLRMALILNESAEGAEESSRSLAGRILGAYKLLSRHEGETSQDIIADKKGTPTSEIIENLQTLGIETSDLLNKSGKPKKDNQTRRMAAERLSAWMDLINADRSRFLEETHENAVRVAAENNPTEINRDAFKYYVRKNAEDPNKFVWIHQYPELVKSHGGTPRQLTQEQRDELEPPSALERGARSLAERASRVIKREVREFRGTTEAAFEEQGQTIETGTPVTLSGIRRTEEAPAPTEGDSKQQRLEPREEGQTSYVNAASPEVVEGNQDPNAEGVQITFQNPLVIPFNEVNEEGNTIHDYDETSWKQKLSQEYGGKTGSELVQALRDDGFDGIITTKTRKGVTHTSEIVALNRGTSIQTKKDVREEAPVAKKEAPVAKKEAPVTKEEAPVAKKEAPVAKEKTPVEGKPVEEVSKTTTETEADLEGRVVELFTKRPVKGRRLSLTRLQNELGVDEKTLRPVLKKLKEKGLVVLKPPKKGKKKGQPLVSFQTKAHDQLVEGRRVSGDLRNNVVKSLIKLQEQFEKKQAERDPEGLKVIERPSIDKAYVGFFVKRLAELLKDSRFPVLGNESIRDWIKRHRGNGDFHKKIAEAIKKNPEMTAFLSAMQWSPERFADRLAVAGDVQGLWESVKQELPKDAEMSVAIASFQAQMAAETQLRFMAKSNALLHQRIFRGLDPATQPFGEEPKEYRLPLKTLQEKYALAITSLKTMKDGRPVYGSEAVPAKVGKVIPKNVVDSILEARVQIVIAWRYTNTLPADLAKVVGKETAGDKRQTKFYDNIKEWTNEAITNQQIREAITTVEHEINRGVPESSRWRGMSNLVLMQAMTDGDQSLANEDKIQQIVKNIRIVGAAFENGQQLSDEEATGLRESLLRSFMAIDTLIDYSDLDIVIQRIAENHRGEYDPVTKELRISDPKEFVHTIPHELGHYLAHKWIMEAVGENIHESLFSFGTAGEFKKDKGRRNNERAALAAEDLKRSSGEQPQLPRRMHMKDVARENAPNASEWRLEWMNQAREFVGHLQKYASTSVTEQEYWGSADEVFARFVSDFVNWTEQKALSPAMTVANKHKEDGWGDTQFNQFARLLQSKQMVDEKDSNPYGSDFAVRATPFVYAEWMETLPPPVMAELAQIGGLIIYSGVKDEAEFRKKFAQVIRHPVNMKNLGFASVGELAEEKLIELSAQIDAMEQDLMIPSLRHGIFKLPPESRDHPTSKETSVNKDKSALYTAVKNKDNKKMYKPLEGIFKKGGKNFDVGAGHAEPLTKLLKKDGVTNFPFDPYNQPLRLEETINEIRKGVGDPALYVGGKASREENRKKRQAEKFDTATMSNVLNVIMSGDIRSQVIQQAASALKDDGILLVTVYEKSGKAKFIAPTGEWEGGEKTSGGKSWQANRKTATYKEELLEHFDTVTQHGNVLKAENPKGASKLENLIQQDPAYRAKAKALQKAWAERAKLIEDAKGLVDVPMSERAQKLEIERIRSLDEDSPYRVFHFMQERVSAREKELKKKGKLNNKELEALFGSEEGREKYQGLLKKHEARINRRRISGAQPQGGNASEMLRYPAVFEHHIDAIYQRSKETWASLRDKVQTYQASVAPIRKFIRTPSDGGEAVTAEVMSTRVPYGAALFKEELGIEDYITGQLESHLDAIGVDSDNASILYTRLKAKDGKENLRLSQGIVQSLVGHEVMARELLRKDSPYRDQRKSEKKALPLTIFKESDLKKVGPGPDGWSVDRLIEETMVGAMKANLTSLYNNYPKEWRERAKQWYEGANKIAFDLTNKYNEKYQAKIASGEMEPLHENQVAAILASQSPQADWNQNIARADRLIAIYRHFDSVEDQTFTEELFNAYVDSRQESLTESLKARVRKMKDARSDPKKYANEWRNYLQWERDIQSELAYESRVFGVKMTLNIEGMLDDTGREVKTDKKSEPLTVTIERTQREGFKTLSWKHKTDSKSDPMTAELKAKMVRAFEETEHYVSYEDARGKFRELIPKRKGGGGYLVYGPDGKSTGRLDMNKPKQGKPMVPSKMSWGSYPEIAKAISLMEDGSPSNISQQIGWGHKVRSFYNNIIAPEYGDAVTIDTHAIGAALLQAVGSADDIVKLTMGNVMVPGQGIRGINPVVAEAYFQAAEELGVLPRELQSVTWEAARGLFPTELKKGAREDVLDSKGQPVTDKETGKTKTVDASLSTFTKDAWKNYQEGKEGYRSLEEVFNKIAVNAEKWAGKDADNEISTYGTDSSGRRIFRGAAWSDAATTTSDDENRVFIRDEPGGPPTVSARHGRDFGDSALAGRTFTGQLGGVLDDDAIFLRRRDKAIEVEKRGEIYPSDYPKLDTTSTEYVEEMRSQLVRFLGHMTASADMSLDGPPRFYSELADLIRSKTTNRRGDIQRTVRRDEVLAWVRDPRTKNPRNGVKSDELDFLGFDLWLSTQGPSVKTDDILDYIESNTIDIVEFTNYPFDPGQSNERLREGIGLSSDERLAVSSQRALVPAPAQHREWTVRGGYNHRVMALVWRPRGGGFDRRFTKTHQLYDDYTPEQIDDFDTRGFMAQSNDIQSLREFIDEYFSATSNLPIGYDEDVPLSVSVMEALQDNFPYFSDVLSQFDDVSDFSQFLDGYERASSPPHPGANVLGWVRMTDRVTPVYTEKDVNAVWQKYREALRAAGFFSANEADLDFNQRRLREIDAQIEGEENEAVRDRLFEEIQELEKKSLGVIGNFTRTVRREWALDVEQRVQPPYVRKKTKFGTPDFQSDTLRARRAIPKPQALVESGALTEREKVLLIHDAEYQTKMNRSGVIIRGELYETRYVGSQTARDLGLERTQLLVEEVQSDWHQAPYEVLEQMANRYGALLEWRKDVLEDADQLAHVEERMDQFPLPREVRDRIEQNLNAGEMLHKGLDPKLAFYEYGPDGRIRSMYENELGERGPLEVPVELEGDVPARHRSRSPDVWARQDKTLVPDAPLKRQWVMNAMRRVIRRGVEGGYDSVAWTDAETQRSRWSDQAKGIAEVKWSTKDGVKIVRLTLGDGLSSDLEVGSTGTILSDSPVEAWQGAQEAGRDFWDSLHGRTLSRVISQEVQKKVLGSEKGSLIPKKGASVLLGESAFGGFYDGKLRNDLRRYVKQWGTEPRHGTIAVRAVPRGVTGVDEAAGVWSFDITDSMRSGVMQKGDPYYSKKSLDEEVLRQVMREHGISYDEAALIAKEEGYNVIRSTPSQVTPIEDDGEPVSEMKKGSPTKKGRDPRDPKRVTDDDGKPLVPAGDIIKKLAAALGNIPVNIGRTFGARGKQDKDTKGIWLQIADELDVFAHEIGHHLHQSLFAGATQSSRRAQNELYALGETTAHSGASRSRRIQEGAAEFFRYWSHHPEMAKEIAPEYYKEFEKRLKRLEPPLRRAIQEFQEEYVRLYDANPDERAATQIAFNIESSPFVTHNDMLFQWETWWINEYAPIKRAVREMTAIERGNMAGMKDPRLLRSRGRLEDILGEKDMPEMIMDNAFRMAELAKGSSMKARGFLDHGVQDRTGKLISVRDDQGRKKTAFWDRASKTRKKGELGGGLEAAWEPVIAEARKLGVDETKHLAEFAKYLVFRHVPEVEQLDKETGIERGAAQRWIKNNETEAFKEAAQNIYDFQNSILEYAKDEGMINQELVNRLRNAYKNYVPFQRVQDQSELQLGARQAWKKFAASGKPIQAMKGSGRQIINPLESIVKNTFQMVRAVENNRALQILTDQADRVKPGEGARGTSTWLERVTAPRDHIVVPRDVEQIKKSLSDQGYDLGEDVNLDALIHVFRPKTTPTHPNEFTVLKDGERVFYRVNNPALLEAITGLGESNPELFNAIFASPAQLLRRTATATFEFWFRNPMRDTYQAWTTSRHGYKPWMIFGGLWEIFRTTKFGKRMGLTESGMYRAFMNSGAGGHTLGSLDRNTVQEQLRRYKQVRRGGWSFIASIPSTMLEGVLGVQEALENATRLGEFQQGVKQLEAKGIPTEEVYARAAYSAAEVTVNFKRMGSKAKQWNKWKAFFNAALQGKVRLAEVFKRDPWGALTRALGSVTSLSVALWFINSDDPEYHDLPLHERHTYWHIPLGKGKNHGWQRIPKPFDLAHIFGNIPEAMLDWMHSYKKSGEMTKEEWDEFRIKVVGSGEERLWSTVGVVVPTAIMPAMEVLTNYSTFRRRAIVSPFDESLAPELQVNRYTSQTARYLAGKFGELTGTTFLGASKIDHLIQGHTAGIGRYVTDIIDGVAHAVGDPASPPTPLRGEEYSLWEGGPSIAPSRMWGVRAIVRGGSASGSSASLSEFFELRDHVQSVRDSIRDFEETNQREKAAKWRSDYRDILRPSYLRRLNDTADDLRKDKNRLDKLYTRGYGLEPVKIWDIPNLYRRYKVSHKERIRRGKEVERLWGKMINRARRFLGDDPIY